MKNDLGITLYKISFEKVVTHLSSERKLGL